MLEIIHRMMVTMLAATPPAIAFVAVIAISFQRMATFLFMVDANSAKAKPIGTVNASCEKQEGCRRRFGDTLARQLLPREAVGRPSRHGPVISRSKI
jgi:hypothetical protein